MTDFLNALRKFIETVAPALAVVLFNYEEDKADAAIKAKEAAELTVKNLNDEKQIRDSFAGKSDADIIASFEGGTPGPTEPAQPKPGSGS